ncbi:cmgc/cdk/pitslre protein kinase [Viridothelium virens]|uniref:cyclin-dependent kinase n=1 Tax=Viridothelium virens TaxID=1048519 RepID=A0A6A6HFB5_VIRVR|nr:cmgc/cdk/pitslre protein kinase [Viridothelium virens]
MTGKSRWTDDKDDAVVAAQRKKEREEKKRAKAEKQRRIEEAQLRHQNEARPGSTPNGHEDSDRPAKRRKVTPGADEQHGESQPRELLRFDASGWGPCRHVDNFERLNHIEEGSYGWVSRARETATGEIVALKKLKMDNLNDGFPITAMREIQTLMQASHLHIVELREIVVGTSLNDVFMVMEFLEHDLKTLQEDMSEPFAPSELKTILLQLTSAVAYLHFHWILHRDLKTSNILMNNRGEIKVADFGMARFTGDPPPALTQLVVTLWYRAPELLLGTTTYDSAIDMWSLGCIFAELLTKEPLFQGSRELDQLLKIFDLLGPPTTESWPTFRRLPNARAMKLPPSPSPHLSPQQSLRRKFPILTGSGVSLLASLLSLNPEHRLTAEETLQHEYFRDEPRPKSKSMMPTFPSKAGQERRRRRASPNAPQRGDAPKIDGNMDSGGIFGRREDIEGGAGFQLKMG